MEPDEECGRVLEGPQSGKSKEPENGGMGAEGLGRGELESPEKETPSDKEPDAWTRKAPRWHSEKDSDRGGRQKAWPRVQVSRGP